MLVAGVSNGTAKVGTALTAGVVSGLATEVLILGSVISVAVLDVGLCTPAILPADGAVGVS